MDVTVHAPRPSLGWLWAVGLALLVLASGAPLLVAPEVPPVVLWTTLGVILPVGLWSLALAVLFPAMRYELHPDALIIRYGPVLTYRLAYGDITDIRRRDLQVSLWSSMRVPGLALFGVPYSDVGTVKMCSTRAAQGVLLIEAAGKLYGISPAEEERFVAELTSRVRQETS